MTFTAQFSVLMALLLAGCALDNFAFRQVSAPPPIVEPPWPPPCATQEFLVHLEHGSTNLDARALDSLATNLDLARACNVLIAVIASHDPGKGLEVRRAMVVQGFPDTLIQIGQITSPTQADEVRVTILFR